MKQLKPLFYYSYSVFEMVIGFKNWLSLAPLFIKKSTRNIKKLKLRRPPLNILVRSAMDIWSVKETFLDKFYTRFGTSIKDGWIVIDIGAGIGDYSLYAAHNNPAGTVYAFEPFAESYELLVRNLALNGKENVFAFQKAVWSEAGKIQLDLSTGEPLQIRGHDQPGISDIYNALSVEAIGLQDLINEMGIKKIDLLKLDCEGSEYEILFKTPEDALRKVERIIMEYHDLNTKNNHRSLTEFLQSQGYIVKTYPNFVHSEIGYLFALRA
jgi:FkbM family methyltransferase